MKNKSIKDGSLIQVYRIYLNATSDNVAFWWWTATDGFCFLIFLSLGWFWIGANKLTTTNNNNINFLNITFGLKYKIKTLIYGMGHKIFVENKCRIFYKYNIWFEIFAKDQTIMIAVIKKMNSSFEFPYLDSFGFCTISNLRYLLIYKA